MSETIAASGPAEELHSAALRPVVGAGRRFWLLFIGLALVAGVGAAAYVIQFVAGGLSVTNYNDQVFWATYESSLVAFIGFSYGGALVSAILRVTNASWRGGISRIAEVSALATLCVGALFAFIHLGHPERVWEMVTRPNLSSPLFWDMVAIATYMFGTLMLLGLPLIPDTAALQHDSRLSRFHRWLYHLLSLGWIGSAGQRRALNRALLIISILIVPMAVIVHTVLSYAFSLTSRPGWNSTIFGPYFVIAAIYSGVAVVILASLAYRRAYRLQRWIDERSIRNLAFVMAALGIAYAYTTFTELTTEGFVGEQASVDLVYSLVLARFAPLFWLFVGMGVVVPLGVVLIPRLRTSAGIGIAAGSVIVAMFLKRLLIVVPPLERPLIAGDPANYFPSPIEMAIIAGAAAGVALIMLTLFRFLPVLSIDEIEEIEREQQARSAAPAALPAARLGEVADA